MMRWLLLSLLLSTSSALVSVTAGAGLRLPLASPAATRQRFAVRASPPILCTAGDGGDGGVTGGGGGRGGGEGEGEGEGDEENGDVDAILAKTGVDADSLPEDVLAALKAGRIGESELTNWKSVLGNPLTKALAASTYIRCRLLAEPRLPGILGIECGVGCLSTLAAEKAARGSSFVRELDFVFANQVLIVLTNIALVLALTPAAAIAAPPAAGTYAAYAARLPGYFLQKGDFTVAQRAYCFVSKAVQFSVVGSCTSAVGQAVTLGIVKARTALTPDKAPTVELAPVLPTASAYAVFMGASSNTRYQVVNSLEGNVLGKLPGGARAQTLVSFIVRTGNNYLGSSNWIWWAKFRGLQ